MVWGVKKREHLVSAWLEGSPVDFHLGFSRPSFHIAPRGKRRKEMLLRMSEFLGTTFPFSNDFNQKTSNDLLDNLPTPSAISN
jgi:hypothetical protein